MPQLAEQSNGLVDALTTQGAQLTTLTQTVARGVPALRDAAENVLELNPATDTPLLASNANDVALSFNSGALSVVDSSGQNYAQVFADQLNVADGSSVHLDAGGLTAPSVTLSDYLYCSGVNNSSVFMQNGDINGTGTYRASAANFGGIDINSGGIATHGLTITAANFYADSAVTTGGATMDSGGIFGTQVNGLGGSFGGIDINSGGIATHGRTVTAANFFADSAVTTGGAKMDGGGVFGSQVNGLGASFGGIDINGGGLATHGRTITTGNCYADNNVTAFVGGFSYTNAGVLSYTALVPPPSERRLKTEESLIDNGLEVVRALVPARWRWREQPAAPDVDAVQDQAVHAGVYVDEIADAAPELLVHRPGADRATGPRSYEDRGLIAYLVAAVQELADRNDALTARLDALEATA